MPALLVGVVACSSGDRSGDDAARDLDVFAATSLTDVFADLASGFEQERSEVDVRLNVAGSSTLREQILDGAPADVFASASESVMATLFDAGRIAQEPVVFARNRLQIAVPAGNPGGVTGLTDFGDADLLIGLCASGVPCGDFAREALRRADVVPSPDTNEPDVRALLTKISSGELDAGIVYATDVLSVGSDVEGIDIPSDFTPDVTYPIAVTSEASEPTDAAAFVAYVISADGQAILDRYGFGRP